MSPVHLESGASRRRPTEALCISCWVGPETPSQRSLAGRSQTCPSQAHRSCRKLDSKMNFDVDKRTIILTRGGSHSYGLNVPSSDDDFKGVCIKPREAYFGFTQKFE